MPSVAKRHRSDSAENQTEIVGLPPDSADPYRGIKVGFLIKGQPPSWGFSARVLPRDPCRRWLF
jgi:hypothetical protein